MIVMKRRGAESDGRERLMDAALALFADRGYDGVAIHEIAEAAGMTRAAPYYHFQNKEDLFLATVSREMERTAAKLAAAVKAAPTFRAQLIAVIETFLMVQGSSVGQFIADVKQNLSPSSLKRFETCHRQTMAVLQGVFDEAYAAGEYGRVSPRVAFQYLLLAGGRLHGARADKRGVHPAGRWLQPAHPRRDGRRLPPWDLVVVDASISGVVSTVVAEIVERFDPVRIVLLGSHATGQADEGSDVDLLVVMSTQLRPLQQAAAISHELDHRIPVDILVRTPQQVASPDPRELILRTILRDGVVAYEAGNRRVAAPGFMIVANMNGTSRAAPL